MKERENDNTTEIDLMVVLGLLWENILIIIVSMIFFGALSFLITKFFMTPMYTSTTTMNVLNKNNEANNNVTLSDLQTTNLLVNDYLEVVKSRRVLRLVIEDLKLDVTVSDLSKRVSVTTPNNSRILVIKATDPSPTKAKKIADAVAKHSGDFMLENMNAEKVSIIDEAEVPLSPSSPNVMRNLIIGAILGMIIPIAIIVILYIFDDTIKDEEDVEKYIGLPVLASIPFTENLDDSIDNRARKRVNEKRAKSQH